MEIRVMMDSNIWISGLMFEGNENDLIDKLLLGDFKIYTCHTVQVEVIRALVRKFQNSNGMILYFKSYADISMIEVSEREKVEPFDDDDLRILDTAIRSDCDFFITGDKRILSWGSFGKLQIVRTVDMLRIIEE
jgi:putative PIN family toxin of toxin-antitoxin system